MSNNWIKPENWGGYDTAQGNFYLQTKTGEKIFDDSPQWNEEYQNWLSGKSQWFIYGFKN
jgi:hypothetical protein